MNNGTEDNYNAFGFRTQLGSTDTSWNRLRFHSIREASGYWFVA